MKLNALISLIGLCLLAACSEPASPPIEAPAPDPATTEKLLVLAIDGGGIKGIIPATFLTLLESRVSELHGSPVQTYQMFDVMGGTSTGGIITIGLTAPMGPGNKPRTARDVLSTYTNDCGKIFVPVKDETGPDYYATAENDLGYKEEGVEIYLQDLVTTTATLADASNNLANKKVQQVFTTTYLINSSGGNIASPLMGRDFGPYLFNWRDAKSSPEDNYRLWEAARATSAAPTYFPVAHVGGGGGSRSAAAEKWALDGGVMSNDPAMFGLAEALVLQPSTPLGDITVVSLGCGLDRFNGGLNVTGQALNHQPFGQKYGFWGDADWITDLENLDGKDIDVPVLELALYANQFAPAEQLKMLSENGGPKYFRIQPDLPADLTPMDACSNTASLSDFAHRYFTQGPGRDQVEQIAQLVVANL